MPGRWKPASETMAVEMSRTAQIDRRTAETDVHVTLALDGSGEGTRETGVGFLDHMLDLLARHARLDLTVNATGDLETGAHHTVEDVGICIGKALDEALGDRAGIMRFGQATVPMDESRASCAIDISGRGLLAFEPQIEAARTEIVRAEAAVAPAAAMRTKRKYGNIFKIALRAPATAMLQGVSASHVLTFESSRVARREARYRHVG